MAKITNFIIAMIIVGLTMAIFALYLSNVQGNYDVNYGSSNINVSLYNHMDELNLQVEESKNATLGITKNKNILDYIGDYFAGGYKAIKISAASVDIFGDVAETAVGQMNLGVVGEYLKTALITIVIVTLIIGVLVAALLKWYV